MVPEFWLVLVSASWLMMKEVERWGTSRGTEIHGVREKRLEGEEHKEETVRQRGRLLFLHHYSNTSFFLLCLIFSFYYSLSSLIFSFYYSSPLFVSLSLVFISLSLPVFCCSDSQTNEPWNIRHQDTEELLRVSVCVHVRGRPYAGGFLSGRTFVLLLFGCEVFPLILESSPTLFNFRLLR